MKKVDELEQFYNDCCSTSCLNSNDKIFFSSLLLSLNKVDESLQILASIKRSDNTSQTNAALMLKNLKRYSECITTCAIVSAEDDVNMYAKAQLIWADALYRLRRRDEAFEAYRRLKLFHNVFYSEAKWQLLIKFSVKAILQNILEFLGKA